MPFAYPEQATDDCLSGAAYLFGEVTDSSWLIMLPLADVLYARRGDHVGPGGLIGAVALDAVNGAVKGPDTSWRTAMARQFASSTLDQKFKTSELVTSLRDKKPVALRQGRGDNEPGRCGI